jgi:hypothetical protein
MNQYVFCVGNRIKAPSDAHNTAYMKIDIFIIFAFFEFDGMKINQNQVVKKIIKPKYPKFLITPAYTISGIPLNGVIGINEK